jgi:hypothetical protein
VITALRVHCPVGAPSSSEQPTIRLQDGFSEDAERTAETMAVQQVTEAYQALTHFLNEQPMSIVTEAFWDTLIARPHR